MSERQRWTVIKGDKVAVRKGKVAWTSNVSEAESWANAIGGIAVNVIEASCKMCGRFALLDQYGFCEWCVNGMGRTKGN